MLNFFMFSFSLKIAIADLIQKTYKTLKAENEKNHSKCRMCLMEKFVEVDIFKIEDLIIKVLAKEVPFKFKKVVEQVELEVILSCPFISTVK
jgi:hypothetical protein